MGVLIISCDFDISKKLVSASRIQNFQPHWSSGSGYNAKIRMCISQTGFYRPEFKT